MRCPSSCACIRAKSRAATRRLAGDVFGAAAKQNHDLLAIPAEIDPISRTKVYAGAFYLNDPMPGLKADLTVIPGQGHECPCSLRIEPDATVALAPDAPISRPLFRRDQLLNLLPLRKFESYCQAGRVHERVRRGNSVSSGWVYGWEGFIRRRISPQCAESG
jgi:hypothetical protein